jgi:hypothetical protein
MSPILTPERYAEAYMRKKQNQSDVQRAIKSSLLKSTGREVDQTFTQSVSQNFLVSPFSDQNPHRDRLTHRPTDQDWMVKSGKSQQILDLIRSFLPLSLPPPLTPPPLFSRMDLEDTKGMTETAAPDSHIGSAAESSPRNKVLAYKW